jgi:hypothetical protein
LSQFEFFHDDWLDLSDMFRNGPGVINFPVNLGINFFKSLKLDDESVKNYRIDAAKLTAESMGDRIALCFSGGADSQCMVQCFIEAGVPFDLYILRFKNNLNTQDADHAVKYCEQFNIKYNIIEIDVLSFLSRENYDYGMKYQSPSPHFNVHYKLFDILRSNGYDGIVAGGNAFFYSDIDEQFLPNSNRNCYNYVTYSKVNQYKCQGNFLSFYPKLTWAISLLSPSINYKLNSAIEFNEEERNYWEYKRYVQKIQGYKRTGFNILPQSQKFTGFELVKKHLEQKTGDGWTFERLYRHPLEKILSKHYTSTGQFIYKDANTKELINSIYRDNFLSGQGAASGI